MVDKEILMLDEETLMFYVKVPMFELRSFLSEVKILVRKALVIYIGNLMVSWKKINVGYI